MVSHDLQRSTVTNQTALNQRHMHWIPEFECTMELPCQALVSRLETSDIITFT